MPEANEPKMTEAQLLSANLMDLSEEMLAKRAQIISIRKNERELEVASNDNEQYQIKKRELARQRRIGIENAEMQRQKTSEEQTMCHHNTGGEGLAGILQGDGAIYGSSTCGLELPTGELYYLCCRCHKEWHHPRWTGGQRAVIDGEMSMYDYEMQERDYNEIARRPRKTFAPFNGEYCAASKFNIPHLQALMAKDEMDFRTYLLKQKDAGPGRKPNQPRL